MPTNEAKVIEIPMTWSSMLPVMLAVYSAGSWEGRQSVEREFKRMAEAADLYNSTTKGK